MVVGIVVSVIGGFVTWSAVDRLDDAHRRAAIARGLITDLRSMLDARLDEALDRVGLDGSSPIDDEELQETLSLLTEEAGADGAEAADRILALDAELREDAAAGGAADEVLVNNINHAQRELRRATVIPAAREADAARDTARWTVAVVLGLSALLWTVAAWLGREARA